MDAKAYALHRKVSGAMITKYLQNGMIPSAKQVGRKWIIDPTKADQELDNIILSETDDPTVSPTEFFQIIQAETTKDLQDTYKNILELETAKALTDKSFGDPVRSVIIDQEELTVSPDELTVEESNRLLSTDRYENLTAALLKLNTLKNKY